MYNFSDIYYSEKEYITIDFDKIKKYITNTLNLYFPYQETCDFGSIITFSYQDHLLSISMNGNINTFYNNINLITLIQLKLNLVVKIFKEQLNDFSIIDEFGNKIIFNFDDSPILINDNFIYIQALPSPNSFDYLKTIQNTQQPQNPLAKHATSLGKSKNNEDTSTLPISIAGAASVVIPGAAALVGTAASAAIAAASVAPSASGVAAVAHYFLGSSLKKLLTEDAKDLVSSNNDNKMIDTGKVNKNKK